MKLQLAGVFLVTTVLLGLVRLTAYESTEPESSPEPAAEPGARAERRKPLSSQDRHGDPLPPGAIGRFGTMRLRTPTCTLAVAADGKTLFTVIQGRTLGHWDAATGELRGETYLPGPAAHSTWLSADGRTLAVGEEGGVGLWDTASRRRLMLLAVPPWTTHVAFASNGRTVATADYKEAPGRIRLWDLTTGQDRLLAEVSSYENELAFGPDGKRLFAAACFKLRCWDTASGRQLWQSGPCGRHLTVAPDGKSLCTDMYEGGPLQFWDAESGRNAGTTDKTPHRTVSLAFSPDGEFLAQATAGEALLWDVGERTLRHRLEGAGPALAFAPNGRWLFSNGEGGHLLRRWEVASGKLLSPDTQRDGHIGPVMAVAFALDGRALASSGADATVRIWKLPSGEHRVLRADGPPGWTWQPRGEGCCIYRSFVPLQFTPDGRQLLTSLRGGALALTEVDSGKETRRFHLPQPKEGAVWVEAAQLTVDGRALLALGKFNQSFDSSSIRWLFDWKDPVVGWDVATGREVLSRTVDGRGERAAFAPSGRWLALPSSRAIRDLRTRGVRRLEASPSELGTPLAISADGRFLAVTEPNDFVGVAKAVRVYEVLTGRQVVRVEANLGYSPALDLSPDGRFLAASGTDALHVWEAASGRPLLRLEARGRLPHWTPAAFATCLTFAPDGRSVATGHADGTIVLWDLAPAWKGLGTAGGRVNVEACWDELAAHEPARAWAAAERLVTAPARAVALLRARLQPQVVDRTWLTGQLAELACDSFARREAATRQLAHVAEAVESDLRRALAQSQSLETQCRLQHVLDGFTASKPGVPSPQQLRRLRAIVVLEWFDSVEARALLRELAEGAADAPSTYEAKAALERLTQRAQRSP